MSNPVSLKAQVALLAAQMETLVKALSASVPVPAVVPNGAVSVSAKAQKRVKAKVYARASAGKIGVNVEHQGLEISFGGPIAPEASASLKAAGFFYNPKSQVWYRKIRPYSPESIASYTASAKTLLASLAA